VLGPSLAIRLPLPRHGAVSRPAGSGAARAERLRRGLLGSGSYRVERVRGIEPPLSAWESPPWASIGCARARRSCLSWPDNDRCGRMQWPRRGPTSGPGGGRSCRPCDHVIRGLAEVLGSVKAPGQRLFRLSARGCDPGAVTCRCCQQLLSQRAWAVHSLQADLGRFWTTRRRLVCA
jgi:hypothetical protein